MIAGRKALAPAVAGAFGLRVGLAARNLTRAAMQNDVRALTMRVQKLEKAIALLRAPVRTTVSPMRRLLPRLDISKTPVREFLGRHHPTSKAEMTLLLAYYLKMYKDHRTFTLKDLGTVFVRAKEMPGDLRENVDVCMKDGLVERDGDDKKGAPAWRVTSRGWRLVMYDFQVRR